MSAWIRRPNALLVVLLIAGTAMSVYAAVVENLAKGSLPYAESVGGPADVTFQKLTFQPGDQSAWHYHTGEVNLVVQSGMLTTMMPCGGIETISAGQAFQEHPGEIHRVYNAGAEPAVIYAGYVVPAGAPRSVNVSEPVCIGPPATADECKAGNWQTFTVPRMFKNEGDCVSWVETRQRP